MKFKFLSILISFLLSVLPALPGGAQQKKPDMAEVNSMSLTAEMQHEIIDWICDKMEENYIDAETAGSMCDYLQRQFKEGAYKEKNTHSAFRQALTHDLQAVSKDLHIRVNPFLNALQDEEIPKDIIGDRRNNYEFKELRHLDGNIGYLRLDAFRDPRYAAPTAVAAMNFLANCDALIIDLRYNGGGYPELVRLMISYFSPEPVHYLNSWKRNGDTTRQYWTYATVQGPRMTDADIYVLMSNDYTFSAAEEFAFVLKNRHQATLIGETTSGGGHSITFFYLPEYSLSLRVPYANSFDPETGAGWEVVGVEPDIKIDSDKAYDTAYVLALDSLRKKAEGTDKASLTWQWEYRKALLDTVTPDPDFLADCAGSYGPVKVITRDDGCYIKEPGSREFKRLHFLDGTRFIIEDNLKIRGELLFDERGSVSGIKALLESGESRTIPKAKPSVSAPAPAVKQDEPAGGDPECLDRLGIAFIPVEGGTFDMGDIFGDGGRAEIPVHAVTLDGFSLSATEITFAQFDAFRKEIGRPLPDDNGWGRGNRPVINISWEDAVAFCEWLSGKSGIQIRLPSEAEWEYAARERGKRVRFGNGKDCADPAEINFNGDAEFVRTYSLAGANRQQTVPVGSFSANALGLYDMSGNVLEYCSDWYNREYYRNSPAQNPSGPEAGQYRVIRGGSWKDKGAGILRCACRGAWSPGEGAPIIGFRVARSR